MLKYVLLLVTLVEREEREKEEKKERRGERILRNWSIQLWKLASPESAW